MEGKETVKSDKKGSNAEGNLSDKYVGGEEEEHCEESSMKRRKRCRAKDLETIK